MEFTYPAFFIALSALAIPIIIHLFNLRKYKKAYFTNVQLLKEIQFETNAKSKLKHWLILLSRLFAITALVAAFSMPFLPSSNINYNSTIGKTVSIYIDNSFSMSAVNNEEVYLQQAKRKAKAIVNAFENTARFQVLTNDFKGAHQHLFTKDAVQKQIDEIEISPNFRSISSVINRQKDLLNTNRESEKSIFIVSDFQESTFDHASIVNDTSITFNLLPVTTTKPGNLIIDSCWFSSPIRLHGRQEILTIRVRNESETDYNNIPLKLYINGQQKTPGSINIQANTTELVQLSYTNREYGDQSGKVVLRDYPLTFDDQFYFNYQIDSVIQLLSINGGNASEALNALFDTEQGIELTNQSETSIDFGSFEQYDLIILHELNAPSSGLIQELKKYLRVGGNVVIFPTSQPNEDAYVNLSKALELPIPTTLDTSKTMVKSFNEESEIFINVFKDVPKNPHLPIVFQHFNYNKEVLKNSESLLTFENGDFFLKKFPFSKGRIYLFSSPLAKEASNFANHSIFVPTMYNIALNSQAKQTLFYTIGKNTSISVENPGNSETVYHLTGEQTDIIPALKIKENSHSLFFHNQIQQDGNYLLSTNSNALVAGVAFNYDRKESYLDNYNHEQLNDLIRTYGWKNFNLYDNDRDKSLASLISFVHQGKPLWEILHYFGACIPWH